MNRPENLFSGCFSLIDRPLHLVITRAVVGYRGRDILMAELGLCGRYTELVRQVFAHRVPGGMRGLTRIDSRHIAYMIPDTIDGLDTELSRFILRPRRG